MTETQISTRLADHTTLGSADPARGWRRVTSEQEYVETVAELDAADEPVLVLGGGSNVVIADDGFDGTVVEVANLGVEADEDGCTGAIVRVGAGEDWDAFVATAIEREWSGVEMLSGIPGRVGAAPIQNVGAYGGEVADTVADRARLGSPDPPTGHIPDGELRVRLPDLAVQGRARSLS